MKAKQLDHDGQRQHVLVFEKGDEVMQGLRDFVRGHDIHAAHFTAIGAFRSGTLAYFDWDAKNYLHIPVESQVEVLSLSGDVAWKDGEPEVHAHAVLGRHDGSTLGGHLIEGTVRPTLEVALTEGGALERRYDPESHLALISP